MSDLITFDGKQYRREKFQHGTQAEYWYEVENDQLRPIFCVGVAALSEIERLQAERDTLCRAVWELNEEEECDASLDETLAEIHSCNRLAAMPEPMPFAAGDKANLDEVHELLDLIHENGIHDLDQYPVERMQTTLGRVLCEVLHELETLREGDR